LTFEIIELQLHQQEVYSAVLINGAM